MLRLVSVFLLCFLSFSVFATNDNSNNAHLKQTFRYAKEVNPVDFLKLDPRVIEMIGGVAKFCKENKITFMITSAIRSEKRNREVKSKSTTHVEGRAIDFSIKPFWGWNKVTIRKLEKYIENRYGQYGLYGPFLKQKVIVIHDAGNGSGWHAHLQVTRDSLDDYSKVIEND